MAQLNNFTLVGSVTGTGAGTLQLSNLQAGDLVFAVSGMRRNSCFQPVGAAVHIPDGVEADVIYSVNSFPAEARFVGYGGVTWRMEYYQNWQTFWTYMDTQAWLSGNVGIASRLTVYRVRNNGTLRVEFFDPTGGQFIVRRALYAWRPDVTVGQHETLKDINIAQSTEGPIAMGTTMLMPVRAGDILIASGMAAPGSGGIVLTGVTATDLVPFTAEYGGGCTVMRVWFIRQNGVATLACTGMNHARMAMKLLTHLVVAQTQYSSPPPGAEVIWVEIPVELTNVGRVLRPNWFENLRTTYAWSNSLGLRKRWVKGAPIYHEGTVRARMAELWKVPREAASSIPTGEAIVFVNEQDAEARVIYHDAGW